MFTWLFLKLNIYVCIYIYIFLNTLNLKKELFCFVNKSIFIYFIKNSSKSEYVFCTTNTLLVTLFISD